MLKLAISRLDPIYVLRGLQTGPTAFEIASDITILLDSHARTAQLVRANGTRAEMPLARQEKRFKLLHAFASRDVSAGAMLDYETLNSLVNDSNGRQNQNPWEAMNALAHQINEATRELLKDQSIQVMHASVRQHKQRGIIMVARCRFKTPETEIATVALEDVTGISAATGEAY